MLAYKKIQKQEIENAIDNKEFSLFYQPIMNFKTDSFETFEAFVRWHHPTLGTLPPSIFINQIEKHGLQEKLTHYIMNAAIEKIIDNNNYGLGEIGVNINLSAGEFLNPNTLIQLKELITKLPYPEFLGLEISPKILQDYNNQESDSIVHSVNGIPTGEELVHLNKLKEISQRYNDLGITLALDTTDEVMSSLIRADMLGLHVIKISSNALQRTLMSSDETLSNLIKASNECQIPLIAVGIDNETLFYNIYKHDFTYVQGFFACPPISLNIDKELHDHLNNYINKKNQVVKHKELGTVKQEMKNIKEEVTLEQKNINDYNNSESSILTENTQRDASNPIYNDRLFKGSDINLRSLSLKDVNHIKRKDPLGVNEMLYQLS